MVYYTDMNCSVFLKCVISIITNFINSIFQTNINKIINYFSTINSEVIV